MCKVRVPSSRASAVVSRGRYAINEVERVAAEASRALLPAGALTGVRSRPDIGPDGDEQVWITLILKDQVVDHIDGQTALRTIDEIQNRLRAEGNDRLVLVEFASQSEFAANGGP